MGTLPDGAAFYDERTAYHTTVKMPAGEIHKLGLSEVARLSDAYLYTVDDLAERVRVAGGRRQAAVLQAEAIVDADEILDLKRVPRSLAVIGASVIGVEYATIFSALDVKVTLIEPGEARPVSITVWLPSRSMRTRLPSPAPPPSKIGA